MMEQMINIEMPLREAYKLKEFIRVFQGVFHEAGYGMSTVYEYVMQSLPSDPPCPKCGKRHTTTYIWDLGKYVCGECETNFLPKKW